MTFMLQNHSFTRPFFKRTAEFLASDGCYYKDLTASHNKSLLRVVALHRACCYFQIPAGSDRFIRSVLVSVSPDFQSDIQDVGYHF